jgi:anti-sigma B factor antagonist
MVRLRVEAEETPDEGLIVVEGELDRAAVPELDQAVTTMYAKRRDVVLDLRRVSFIDAGGVRYLFQASEAVHAGGHRLRVLISNPNIQRLLGLVDPAGELDVRFAPSPS